MKLKQYLRDKHRMTYAQYKALPDIERWSIEGEFRNYNATLLRRKLMQENFIKLSGIIRQATPEDLEEWKYRSDKEKKHREASLKCDGIIDRGYIALHYRH